ncbi:hypothetical protein ACQR1V_06565 [Bradyrhizobium oligotrophicum]|uniref:hypothetical protein n=1 Tax=Bradyrhizobium oligotrophicum TaxID=44255 RepID=UPI003EC10936
MALDDAVLFKIEELKEIGHEQRYREQLMVQEFGLSMTATAVLAGVISAKSGTIFAFVVQMFGLAFLLLLTLHLRNINQDRHEALKLKESVRKALGFQPIHQNIGGRERKLIALSAPRMMVWYAFALSVGWAVWTLIEGTAVH